MLLCSGPAPCAHGPARRPARRLGARSSASSTPRLQALRLLLGILITLAGGRAWAAGAAILPSKASPTLEARERQTLEDALLQALREQKFEVTSSGERDMMIQSEPALKGCGNDACLEHLGRLLGVGVLLRASITVERADPARPGDFTLEVNVFDVEVGASGARAGDRCSGCTIEQAKQLLGDLGRRAVLENGARPRGTLVVTSDPTAGIVFVDGVELGTTPYKRVAFAGPHRLIVKRLGFVSHQSDVEVQEDRKQAVAVKLVEGKDAVEIKTITVEKPGTPVYKKWWFWAALVGAAAVAGGITAGVVLGREVVPNGTAGMYHIKF
ncbi:MAG: PEGA domain-containing protein [Polyangia bacterium]